MKILSSYLYILILSISKLIIFDTADAQTICTIVKALVQPGTYTIDEQNTNGFCREYIIGELSSTKEYTIGFSKIELNCRDDDKLMILSEERNDVLLDYCSGLNRMTLYHNYLLVQAKYIHLRLSTRSPHRIQLILTFLANQVFSTTHAYRSFPIPIATTTLAPIMDYRAECPTMAKVIDSTEGTLEFTTHTRTTTGLLNCFWIIQAPPSQKLYLDFDYVNLPTFNSTECSDDFITISSANKPTQFYKLCGQRRDVKIITTYNSVFLNFFYTPSLTNDMDIGFKVTYRTLSDPVATPSTFSLTSTVSYYNMAPSPSCGKSGGSLLDLVGRIVGGTEATPNSFPWQALLTDGFIMCGATLVDNSWLVTAAHCVQNSNTKMLKVYLGMHNRKVSESNRVTKYISKVVMYPSYIGRLNQWDNDIALIKMQEPVQYKKEISPICLPKQGNNLATLGKTGLVTGWGETLGTGSSYVLRQTTISVTHTEACGASSDNMICAGKVSPIVHDSCQGDSGGPFVMKSNGAYYLVGIVSWGYDCNGFGIYTKVSNYANWIHSVVGNSYY